MTKSNKRDNTNVIHLRSEERKYGTRTPAVFLQKDGKVVVYSAINNKTHYKIDSKKRMPKNSLVSLKIDQFQMEGKVIQSMMHLLL